MGAAARPFRRPLPAHRSNAYDVDAVTLEALPASTVRGLLPRGRLGDLAAHALGDRYVGLPRTAARRRHRARRGARRTGSPRRRPAPRTSCGFKLVLTVWETLPLLDASVTRARGGTGEAAARAHGPLPADDRARAPPRCVLEGVADGPHRGHASGDRRRAVSRPQAHTPPERARARSRPAASCGRRATRT